MVPVIIARAHSNCQHKDLHTTAQSHFQLRSWWSCLKGWVEAGHPFVSSVHFIHFPLAGTLLRIKHANQLTLDTFPSSSWANPGGSVHLLLVSQFVRLQTALELCLAVWGRHSILLAVDGEIPSGKASPLPASVTVSSFFSQTLQPSLIVRATPILSEAFGYTWCTRTMKEKWSQACKSLN